MWFPITVFIFAFAGLLLLRLYLSCDLSRFFDPLPDLSVEALQPLIAGVVTLIVLGASLYVVLSGSFGGFQIWSAAALGLTVGHWLRPPNSAPLKFGSR